ncbi:MAG TPA: hypothetical protein VMB50_01230 [Myxococcales bacterium]|nr:hypothetical protein [Myxococcales bacterium]
MALDHVALYVETGDAARLAEILGPVFAQQCESVRRPAAELRLVSFDGWTAALGAEALDGRAILAEGLSRELSVRAAAVELQGAAFRWQLAPFERGKRLRPSGFGAPVLAADEPMPLYLDAELEAYRGLLAIGVAPALALLTPDSSGEPRGALSVRWDGAQRRDEASELRAAPHPEATPPVALAATPEGQVLEPRVVSGRPTAPALRRLLDLEAAYQERARVPLRFVYRHAPENQDFRVARELAQLTEGDRPSLLSRWLRR